MKAATFMFYFLSAMVLASGYLAVTSRKIFRAAIFLLFSLMGIAGLYFLMDMEFLAAVQIIVYVGGIVVLIIFSIFLTQQTGIDLPVPSVKRSLWMGLAALSGLGLTLLQILKHSFIPSGEQAADTGVASIGTLMMSTGKGGYALPFELVSILLLAAMIGCIVIALRLKTETK
jgi:NADH-quinone oxidoreductase subunit J